MSENKSFPNIINWLKNKAISSNGYINSIIGEANYTRFNAKFLQRQREINPVKFAEMFWNELQVMRFTSEGIEKKTIDGYINAITAQYELERVDFENELKINIMCQKNIDNILNLMDIKSDRRS